MNDFLTTLAELPPKHAGVIFEQLHTASIAATFYMRAMGLILPRQNAVPSQEEVYRHLCGLTNEAMDAYFTTQKLAPKGVKPNDVWGDMEDDAFAVQVSGLSDKDGEGYRLTIQYNLLYR